jgi:L-lactate dehydrogenase complex protein LldG
MTASATKSSPARESILESIRHNLAASRVHDEAHSRHASVTEVPHLQSHSSISTEDLIQEFKRNLESVGGHCHIAADRRGAVAALRAAIQDLGAAKIAISDSELIASIVAEIPDVEFVKNADREFLFSSDAGVTSAQWAIAETGTLVLESASERHRLTSLVPPVHICVLETGKLRRTLGEVLGSIETDLNRTVTFITGASRTSDIELTLAIGVHGPRELHVILIDRQA